MAQITMSKKARKQIKKVGFIICPLEIQPIKPILGRIYAIYASFKCIKLLKFNVYGYKFYRIALPKLKWVGD